MNLNFLLPYLVGATLAGIPIYGAIVWLVGRFAFTKTSRLDRPRLVTFSTWVVITGLLTLQGNGLLAFVAFPSFVGIWLIWVFVARRREAARHSPTAQGL